MALSIDGHAITAAGGFGGSATGTINITTAQAKDLIVVVIAAEVFSSPHATVTSVTASGLTFTKRSSVYQDNISGKYAATWNTLEVWSAQATAAVTGLAVTVTMSASIDCGVIGVFGVNLDGVSFPVWSSNASLPATAVSAATSAPTIGAGALATNAAALLFGFCNSALDTNQTAGTGFTLLDTNNNPNGGVAMSLGEEYQAFAGPASGQTVAFGTSYQTWGIIADAIESPTSADTLANACQMIYM